MPDNELLARKISVCLGRQPEVAPHVAYRLGQARAKALARAATPRHTQLQWLRWPSLRVGAGIALLMLGFAYAAWQFNSHAPDFADIDAELLTGELPPAAFLDPGFARIAFTPGK